MQFAPCGRSPKLLRGRALRAKLYRATTLHMRERCDEIASLLRHNGSAYATFLDLKPSVLSLETIASGAAVRRKI